MLMVEASATVLDEDIVDLEESKGYQSIQDGVAVALGVVKTVNDSENNHTI